MAATLITNPLTPEQLQQAWEAFNVVNRQLTDAHFELPKEAQPSLNALDVALARLGPKGVYGSQLGTTYDPKRWQAWLAAVQAELKRICAEYNVPGPSLLSRFWDEVVVQTVTDIPVKAPAIIGKTVDATLKPVSGEVNMTLVLVGVILALWLALKVT